MDISIIIPTYNRRDLLQLGLLALGRQTVMGFSYEVLVCDDGSSDGTQQMCTQMAATYPVPLRLLALAHVGGPSAARNEGTAAAAAPVVVYMDDDIIPDADYVLRHFEFHLKFPQENVVAIGELYTPEHERTNPMTLFSEFPYDHVRAEPKLGFMFFWTGNMSLKRSFMLQHGLFRFKDPVNGETLYFEDIECGYRLMRHGLEIRFLPEARGEHYPTLPPERVAAKGYGTGKGHFRVSQVIPDIAVVIRFGILTPEIGWQRYLKLGAKRVMFRIVDNPLTHLALTAMGASGKKRSRLSDFYYYLIFRRNMIAGYNDEKRAHRQRVQAAGSATPDRSTTAETA
ncbi:MAG: glycosyltransferase family 2 protein [Bryobacteraceae bacterium]|nr:glycosyltransferase family 2 protein [Bryobacteraceae bacterium]